MSLKEGKKVIKKERSRSSIVFQKQLKTQELRNPPEKGRELTRSVPLVRIAPSQS